MYFFNNLFQQSYFPYLFALFLAIPIIVLLRQFVYEYIRLKNLELKMLSVKGNAENKSQAYERMTLFLERIKPSNLVTKFDKNLAIHEFIFLTEKTIQEEFDYNTSQQLYLTKNAWQNIVESKNEVINLLKSTYENTLDNTSLDDFKTVFLMNYLKGNDFVAETIEDLKREVLLVT